CTARYGGLDYW
nr:immunoglobulin heavy chain junction region [Macaca mulatta]MOX95511.1 immunoglobulin heavy chain junction region [Macaca mulatta]